eukprot:4624275-Prymnesium_polylepis.2
MPVRDRPNEAKFDHVELVELESYKWSDGEEVINVSFCNPEDPDDNENTPFVVPTKYVEGARGSMMQIQGQSAPL